MIPAKCAVCGLEGVMGKDFYDQGVYPDSYCIKCRREKSKAYYRDVIKPRRLAAKLLKQAREGKTQ